MTDRSGSWQISLRLILLMTIFFQWENLCHSVETPNTVDPQWNMLY